MANRSLSRGLMIAAPASGSGKTVFSLALMRALKNRGITISPAKAGPDYIDPVYHELAAGTSSINLDPWAMGSERIQSLAHGDVDSLLLVEAMMGLYDGAADGNGSAADLSVELALPIILVVDAAKQSHSIAALVNGFKDFRSDINFAGVVLNKVGSPRHEVMLRDALGAAGIAVMGSIPRSSELALPERHLGLVQAREMQDIEAFIEGAAKLIETHCDLDALLVASERMPSSYNAIATILAPVLPLGQRIAIARDNAFSFIYPHLLCSWKEQGVEISFFSPLADEAPSKDADAVFLPGGYPELHCEVISSAKAFKAGMVSARDRGVLIYGECGGYMVLGEGLVDTEGQCHEMLGLLNLETSFKDRKLHLGYRKLWAGSGHLNASQFTAHEFHYTQAIKENGISLFTAKDALGNQLGDLGLSKENVFGSYMHVIDRVSE
ncbi:MAG: cobyrinate a,c-diamide synthase [Salaquimonas sp.]